MAKFKFTKWKPSKAEKARRIFVQERLQQMDTDYRKSLIKMAALGRNATDGLATEEDRISNAELMKVPISHAVISQRISTLLDNPSRALYWSPNKDKRALTITNKLNEHDKIESNYTAAYQEWQEVCEREGIAVIKQGWHEEFKEIDGKPVSIGKFFTSGERKELENIWWDPAANQFRGESGIVANDACDREFMTLLEFRMRYQGVEDYKNITAVKPVNGDDILFTGAIWRPEWELKKVKSDDPVNDIVLWHFYAINFLDEETGEISDVLIEYANGVEIRKTEINLPKIRGKAQLPYEKLIAIPTTGMGGLSIPALIRHPEKALQRMITMADAQAELAVNPIQFMSSGIMDTIEDAVLFPGARVEVSAQAQSVKDEIYIHTTQDITNGAQYIIDKMLELITLITGVDINAFFESPKAKAISTERKREIQERLLRRSVIYNEAHGFARMEELRLFIMLENYPVKRFLLTRQPDGSEIVVERFPEIPVKGWKVTVVEGDEKKSDDEKKFELKADAKSFSMVTVNPASVEYNTNISIKGATEAANEDTFKMNKSLEKIQVISTNPYTTQTNDPIKVARFVYDSLNLNEEDFMREELEESNSELHGAMKEIAALVASDVINVRLKIDEDYDAQIYKEIFDNFMALPEFKNLPPNIQKLFLERYEFHVTNSLNPYYKETLREANAAAQQGQAEGGGQEAAQANAGAVQQPFNNKGLEENVRSKAGALGKAGKLPVANSKEQT